MNKKLFSAIIFISLIACNSDKKQANAYLENAQRLYEHGEYALAKSNLDSIKALFPKEFAVQKQGLQLRRTIEVKENEQNLILCDSLLKIRLIEAETMKTGFLFEKDPEYDDTGKYMDKSQKIEAKLQSSCIRIYVNESGELFFSSVYHGNRPIQHSKLKVSLTNGDYAETLQIPHDGGLNYSFVDDGRTTEIVTYTSGKDNGVINFIYGNKESVLKAELLGKEKYTFTISATDKEVLVKTVDFAVVLADIDKLKKEIEKSTQRLRYLEGKV